MKDSLQLILVAALVLLIGGFAYSRIFESDSVDALTIRSLEGAVTHSTETGKAEAAIGSVIRPSDRIITSEGGRVELSLGERAELTLEEGSSLALVGSTADGLQVELEGGLVQAVVRPGDGPGLAVIAGGRVAEASDAEFSVGLGRDGTAAVEARAGRVTLVNYGAVESLEEGQRVVAIAGESPQLQDIPKSLLLEVAWPDGSTREGQSRLVGSTQPGAIVWTEVNGKRHRAVADARGKFRIEGVPLSEGVNSLEVQAVGVLGGRESSTGEISRDSKAPTGAFKVEY